MSVDPLRSLQKHLARLEKEAQTLRRRGKLIDHAKTKNLRAQTEAIREINKLKARASKQ